ncbi:lysM domain receptor-like kinase 4 [Solanum stenotomum]|uniref:lysM domain receptor-like kinase 4 n=1 Tax=Solanum stenotomum TaxID=172797 RepID=UPI0020D0DC77|nr:lysM domain receptor-like kinase 4 [Solanum stenotomum]
MNYSHLVFVFTTILSYSSVSILAQQPYFGTGTNDCNAQDTSTSAFGYLCNGANRTCQSYLTFRSQPPFNTVPSISSLLGANPSQLSQLNSVSQNATFNTNQMVLVPVTCSCSGQFYQSNASYVIRRDDTFLNIAINTLQGLSTCHAINSENTEQANNLVVGSRINVPLRCACPTQNQTDNGTNYLLTYLIASGEFVSFISDKFGVDFRATLAANSIPEDAPTVFPNTTLLVPLSTPPLSSQVAGPSPPPPPATTSTPPPAVPVSESSSNKTWIYVVAGVVGGLVALCILGVVVFFLFFRKKEKKADPQFVSESFEAVEKPSNKKVEEESEEFLESLSSIAQSVKVYKFEEVKAATENFSPTCLIKGSVYRGTINGDFAAIKKMSGDVSKEINLLCKINHFNLISLSGICFHDGHWYLVYEYAANGPLSDWICHHNGDHKSLSWAQRVQISFDVATGLNYLHSYTSPPHVHKDLNSDNILLDGDLRAKIANFGLARSADGQEGEFALTRHIVGTQGYMAPEYLENGLVSPKLDVYALGVLLLEILTGKEVSALYEGSNTNLSEVLIPVLHDEDAKENLSNFIDPSLQGKYPAELAFAMVRLIDNCIMKDPSHRPSTDEIVQSVSRIMTATHSWEMSFSTSVPPHRLP